MLGRSSSLLSCYARSLVTNYEKAPPSPLIIKGAGVASGIYLYRFALTPKKMIDVKDRKRNVPDG